MAVLPSELCFFICLLLFKLCHQCLNLREPLLLLVSQIVDVLLISKNLLFVLLNLLLSHYFYLVNIHLVVNFKLLSFRPQLSIPFLPDLLLNELMPRNNVFSLLLQDGLLRKSVLLLLGKELVILVTFYF